MMKRKDLLARLNELTLRYNLTWANIKTDADRAVDQINFLLGSVFPPLSEKFLTEESTYTEREGGVDVPIIADRYFHAVIIPYIGMEILARDEEYTLVFQKFQQDLMQGKFQMFSNEFNHVPTKWKRTRVEGVFFPSNNQGK